MNDDFQIIPNREDREEEKYNRSFGKRLMFAVFGLLLFSSIGAGAYFMGKRSVQGVSTDATPTAMLLSPTSQSTLTSQSSPTTSPTFSTSSSPTLSPKTSPSPFQKTSVLKLNSVLSGSVSSNGLVTSKTDIKLGHDNEQVYRGFASFDLSTLPQGTQIGKATLRLYQSKLEGKPFSSMGAIKIDHLSYGDSLDQNDYSIAALTSGFATIPQGTLSEWKEIDVTNRVKSDITNAKSITQYRIHFSTEKASQESTGDFLYFDATLNVPQLIVQY